MNLTGEDLIHYPKNSPLLLSLFSIGLWMIFFSTGGKRISFRTIRLREPKRFTQAIFACIERNRKTITRPIRKTVKIRLKGAKSYETGINDLVQGKVDFARFGPAFYILAKQQNPYLKIIAIETNKGEKFAFGNDKSTIALI